MKSTIIATTLLLTISTITGTQAETPSAPSRREIKIERRIESLTSQLREQRYALEQERSNRGVVAVDSTLIKREAAQKERAQRIEDSLERVNIAARKECSEYTDPTINFNLHQIDSLLDIWQTKGSTEQYERYFEQYIDPKGGAKVTSKSGLDSLYRARLIKLASPIELPYNDIVKGYINRYTSASSKLMSTILARAQYFYPNIEEQLFKADLPVELRAMAVVESALTTNAISRTGAAGLWQFMPATGVSYGLEVNSLVDERCDPDKATIAACKFMKDLYNMYGDWSLALAAYNCGPGNVNKALARSGVKKGSYWDIYDFLPRETRGYLPAFIGATYAYAYSKEHNIEPTEPPLPLATDTLTITRILHLGQVAEVLDIPLDLLKKLNPQYRRDIIPATTKSYALRLPRRYISQYIEQEEAIHALAEKHLKEYVNPRNIDKLRSVPHGRIHVVRSGDTLSGIAQRYRVTTRQLMSWNKLKSAHKLSIGQKIIVSN